MGIKGRGYASGDSMHANEVARRQAARVSLHEAYRSTDLPRKSTLCDLLNAQTPLAAHTLLIEMRMEVAMTALARTLSRALGNEIDVETLKTIVIFCGIGLTVSLLLALTYGLDLSPGFL